MRSRAATVCSVCAAVVWSASSAAHGDDPGERIAVIVHRDNPVHSLGESDLHALFTTRKRVWGRGGRIVPFNFVARDAVRERFDQAILGMNPDEVAKFWIDRRVRGGDPPPRTVPSGRVMVAVVAKLKGAIGYVDEDLVTDRVRVVAWIEGGKIKPP